MDNIILRMDGKSMHDLAKRLWPIHRSLTGNGVRETLHILKETLVDLQIHNVPSGTSAFDWTVPDEWNIRDAWIEDEFNNRIIDLKSSNLHVMGYSTPVDCWLTLDELKGHLFSLPEKPNSIPYLTSYYSRRWAFCLAHNQLQELRPGTYHAVIDSDIKPGFLTYGEILIPGESKKEILLSTYVCHPSMANNELSGPVVTAALAKWIESLSNRRYSYRIIFIPETIGSLVYLSKHLNHLKANVIAGFNVTCVGDERTYSYLPSRNGKTLSDNVALHVLKNIDPNFKKYTWLDRGSDERQYCAPGIDLPIATISRSLYFHYPEYHTSLDDLTFVTPDGLAGGYMALQRAIECIELNFTPTLTVLGEPQLGKRGLYPSISSINTIHNVRSMMDLLTYCDGVNTLIDIAEIINQPFWVLWPICQKLISSKLMFCGEELDSLQK